MELDIRESDLGEITSIRLSDPNTSIAIVELVIKEGGVVAIRDSQLSTRLYVTCREHAENLIKGFQKAIELGWLE
jgi:hypothetical protein